MLLGGKIECNVSHLKPLIFENFSNHGGLFECRLCPIFNVIKVDCSLNDNFRNFGVHLVPL